MFRTLVSFMLVGLLVLGASSAPALALQSNQTNDDAVEKIRLKAAKIGVGDKAKVTVRMKDGTKIKGFITQAGANDFTVRNRQTGDPTVVLYRDVLKLEDNRGHSMARNIAIGVAIGAGAFLAVLLIVFASLED